VLKRLGGAERRSLEGFFLWRTGLVAMAVRHLIWKGSFIKPLFSLQDLSLKTKAPEIT